MVKIGIHVNVNLETRLVVADSSQSAQCAHLRRPPIVLGQLSKVMIKHNEAHTLNTQPFIVYSAATEGGQCRTPIKITDEKHRVKKEAANSVRYWVDVSIEEEVPFFRLVRYSRVPFMDTV